MRAANTLLHVVTGSRVGILAVVGAAVLLSAAVAGSYYFQAIAGHARLMLAGTPIEQVVRRPGTDERLRERLRLVQEIRAFATNELGLPDNESYREYAALDRDHLVWSVTAVPEFALTPRQWCYPVIGCQSYRSYFDEGRARRLGNELEQQGYDVAVRGVGAYSTLGWFTDPVTDIMLRRSDPELAETIFHELAHQQVHVRGDTMFNESYATFVGEQGVREWLRARGDDDLLARRRTHRDRVRTFNGLLQDKRGELAALYDSRLPPEEMRAHKNRIMASIRTEFNQRLLSMDPGMAYLDAWFDRPVTNARLASIAAYRHWIAAFDELFREHDGDWSAFHAIVEEIAGLPPATRSARMDGHMPDSTIASSAEADTS